MILHPMSTQDAIYTEAGGIGPEQMTPTQIPVERQNLSGRGAEYVSTISTICV